MTMGSKSTAVSYGSESTTHASHESRRKRLRRSKTWSSSPVRLSFRPGWVRPTVVAGSPCRGGEHCRAPRPVPSDRPASVPHRLQADTLHTLVGSARTATHDVLVTAPRGRGSSGPDISKLLTESDAYVLVGQVVRKHVHNKRLIRETVTAERCCTRGGKMRFRLGS